MSERKKSRAEDYDNSDLDERGPVLQIGAFAGAPDVHGGDDSDHRNGNERGFDGGKRDDFGEVTGERAGERGYGAAGDYEEEAPAVEERGHAAKSIANENIEAARFGISRS